MKVKKKECMPTDKSSLIALEKIIKKSRVHFYKPIQIAEILYHHRTEEGWNLVDLESYRNLSKRWRDEISTILIGRKCTSSQKFQDNLFEGNAIPPNLLNILGDINKKNNGIIEGFIYKSIEDRLSSLMEVLQYIENTQNEEFSLAHLLSKFTSNPGLKRSIDKMYEIIVYALFATIVRFLKAEVTIEIGNQDLEVLKDFENFIEMVLGITGSNTKLVFPAALHRVGVTNAADRGLDMWANFGPAIQVKHLSLTMELVEDIVEEITADRIVIVCLDSERDRIENLLNQVGWGSKIQGVITSHDLDEWYSLCLKSKYKETLGKNLLGDLNREFVSEFPSSEEMMPFFETRGYHKVEIPNSLIQADN